MPAAESARGDAERFSQARDAPWRRALAQHTGEQDDHAQVDLAAKEPNRGWSQPFAARVTAEAESPVPLGAETGGTAPRLARVVGTVEAATADQAATGSCGRGEIQVDCEQGLEQLRIGERIGVQRSSERGTMAKVGRNDPCPCGSGQKYKRCCLPREEAAAAEAAAQAAAREREAEAALAAYDHLDEDSNAVIDLIDAGRLDEAEQAAQTLTVRYPEVHDGLERLAMVYAARGDRPRAAEYYRKAADFVHERADQYGPKMEEYFRRKITELETEA